MKLVRVNQYFPIIERILKEENVEVNETQSNGQIKKKQGTSQIKNETGKPLHEMTDDEHRELSEVLHEVKGKGQVKQAAVDGKSKIIR